MLAQSSKSQNNLDRGQSKPQEKSRPKLSPHLEKTPTTPIYNPYIDELAQRTSKKRRERQTALPLPYVPAVLAEQNKQLIELMAENREMTIMIHQKNTVIETLQLQLEQRTANETAVFMEVEAEKKRLIQEILQHKQATGQQLTSLTQKVTTLQQEKSTLTQQITLLQQEKSALQRQSTFSLKQQQLNLQTAHTKVVDELRSQHLQNIAQLRIELQGKERLLEAAGRAQTLGEEMKQLQHVRRIEISELRQTFQARIQKLHLDYRREKELFLVEHDAQVLHLQEELRRLRRIIQEIQAEKQVLKQTLLQKDQLSDNEDRIQYQADANIAMLKQLNAQERRKLQAQLKTEMALLQSVGQQEAAHLASQNAFLKELLKTKQTELQALLKQIDQLRQGRMQELQANEQLVKELESKLLTQLLEGEAESEALKTKLARLRETDIIGLRNYHEHQLQLLGKVLQEKQGALLAAREKLHEELRKKIEMRKSFDLEVLRFRSRILQLQGQLQLLRQNQQEGWNGAASRYSAQSFKSNSRYRVQTDDCKHLQSIIVAKDGEIDELTRRLDQLKQHHALERAGWQAELQAEQSQHDLAKADRNKTVETADAEMGRLKEEMKREREEWGRELQLLREQHRRDFDAVLQDLAAQRDRHQEEKNTLLDNFRRKEFELQNLIKKAKESSSVQSSPERIKVTQIPNKVIDVSQKFDFSRQRQQIQEFYAQKLQQRDSDISDLQERINELTHDLRDARQNYSELERKLQQLMESQGELREVERKVIHLGTDYNLAHHFHRASK